MTIGYRIEFEKNDIRASLVKKIWGEPIFMDPRSAPIRVFNV